MCLFILSKQKEEKGAQHDNNNKNTTVLEECKYGEYVF